MESNNSLIDRINNELIEVTSPAGFTMVYKTDLLKIVQDTNNISDGYHTFGELYEHRIELFIALCNLAMRSSLRDAIKGKLRLVWKSKRHSDGTVMPGWFIAGIGTRKGDMITYHLPISKWGELPAREFERAPELDGHTSADVLQRLKNI